MWQQGPWGPGFASRDGWAPHSCIRGRTPRGTHGQGRQGSECVRSFGAALASLPGAVARDGPGCGPAPLLDPVPWPGPFTPSQEQGPKPAPQTCIRADHWTKLPKSKHGRHLTLVGGQDTTPGSPEGTPERLHLELPAARPVAGQACPGWVQAPGLLGAEPVCFLFPGGQQCGPHRGGGRQGVRLPSAAQRHHQHQGHVLHR